MGWGVVEITLVVAGALLGASLCFLVLLGAARATRRRTPAGGVDREAFERALNEELERARRHERPLTVVRLPARYTTDDRGVSGPRGSVPLRRIDRVFPFQSCTYLVAPETGVEERATLLTRLSDVQERAAHPELGAATFPDDGLSSGALLAICDRTRALPSSGKPPRTTRRERGVA